MTEFAQILLWGAFLCYLLSVNLYLLHALIRRPLLWRGAFALVGLGFLLHSLCLGLRWYLAGYLPVTNLFSTLFFFSWALAAVYLYFELRYRIHAAGLFVMLLNLLLLGTALPRDSALKPLIPALDTPLFTLHIAFSFLGYAFFAMAFSLGVLYLVQRRLATALLPDLALLRRLNEEAIFLGFTLFSLCMLFGGIWAQVAWGYYFSWNIKGLWSFLVWLFYAGMCHAKFVRRWQGTGYAGLSILGFALVLFTYLGIGLLMSSNHPLD
ncbi:cytochrome c biogenesis protein CcsA [Desulfuromonas acetexigens]|uniref:C-type cytochrome biogenesis protein CcsB n=1 Tax=Trichloromonas acetexigens TaxID=38815 RepID=A0A550J885_9BACT|nr:cytochrome c biogenesis protein CcsA [Desulfuromonas acetexigens]TRO79457.1 c-type cytochrome biogenesis protein CcsB [Desulfuromonas acetexigens]